ncbi:MAG: ATP-dependent Clp protease adapter ClpS [Microbacterium sp. SCN 70-27]|nr:ATP-dependent Clp protease adapter ClpS [Microbacterium sp.]ODT28686.1 MAG: ATP-dependent Clp protease adapter ClpS [Microbacterium sp. SCN 70-27]
MGVMSTVLPLEDVDLASETHTSGPWQAVVWNDPVNLMSYVTYVFRTYFGYSRERAENLMLAVHHDGHAIVAEGAREQMELHVQAMHDYGLWATVREGAA